MNYIAFGPQEEYASRVSVVLHQSGDLPDLAIDASGLSQSSGTPVVALRADGAASIYGGTPASVKGNREAKECSNRGICDSKTGECECFQGFFGEDCSKATAFAL